MRFDSIVGRWIAFPEPRYRWCGAGAKPAFGGAANVAQNVLAIGASCDLVAAVGDDRAGESLRSMLERLGAGHSGVVTVRRATTQKTRVLARSQQLVRIDEEEDADLSLEEIAPLLEGARDALTRRIVSGRGNF